MIMKKNLVKVTEFIKIDNEVNGKWIKLTKFNWWRSIIWKL